MSLVNSLIFFLKNYSFRSSVKSRGQKVSSIFILAAVLLASESSLASKVHNRPITRVTIYSQERGHIRTLEDRVNKDLVLSLPPRHFQAYNFECNATYPVKWSYVGDGAPSKLKMDVGRSFYNFHDVYSYKYQAVIRFFDLDPLQSGRYICQGIEKKHQDLSVYYDVFVPGNGSHAFLSTKTKTVQVSKNSPYANIPCAVTDPTVSVSLYRQLYTGSFKKVEPGPSLEFFARKGFRIKMTKDHEPYGTYVCMTTSNQQRKVHVVREYYEDTNENKQNTGLEITYEYRNNRILCCSKQLDLKPKLSFVDCDSILDCKIKSACLEEDRCPTSRYDFMQRYREKNLPYNCVAHGIQEVRGTDHGLLKCSAEGNSIYQPYLYTRGNIFLNFDEDPPTQKIMSMKRITPEPTIVGSKIEFYCNTTEFYFAYGIRWAFKRPRGKIQFISDKWIQDVYPPFSHKRQSFITITDEDILGVICYAPIARSPTEWRTVSLPVQVQSDDTFKKYHLPEENEYQNPELNLLPYNDKGPAYQIKKNRPSGYLIGEYGASLQKEDDGRLHNSISGARGIGSGNSQWSDPFRDRFYRDQQQQNRGYGGLRGQDDYNRQPPTVFHEVGLRRPETLMNPATHGRSHGQNDGMFLNSNLNMPTKDRIGPSKLRDLNNIRGDYPFKTDSLTYYNAGLKSNQYGVKPSYQSLRTQIPQPKPHTNAPSGYLPSTPSQYTGNYNPGLSLQNYGHLEFSNYDDDIITAPKQPYSLRHEPTPQRPQNYKNPSFDELRSPRPNALFESDGSFSLSIGSHDPTEQKADQFYELRSASRPVTSFKSLSTPSYLPRQPLMIREHLRVVPTLPPRYHFKRSKTNLVVAEAKAASKPNFYNHYSSFQSRSGLPFVTSVPKAYNNAESSYQITPSLLRSINQYSAQSRYNPFTMQFVPNPTVSPALPATPIMIEMPFKK